MSKKFNINKEVFNEWIKGYFKEKPNSILLDEEKITEIIKYLEDDQGLKKDRTLKKKIDRHGFRLITFPLPSSSSNELFGKAKNLKVCKIF